MASGGQIIDTSIINTRRSKIRARIEHVFGRQAHKKTETGAETPPEPVTKSSRRKNPLKIRGF